MEKRQQKPTSSEDGASGRSESLDLKVGSAEIDSPRRANRELWDTWTALHQSAPMYQGRIEKLLAGEIALTPLDLEQVGTVEGKSLLHLQCHFGLDTLSWARLGAKVVGVDFSLAAIESARILARKAHLEAVFHCVDVETDEMPTADRYDIIYTSFGVLSWLRNLTTWAQFIARHLAPGGTFHLIEFHPVLGMFDDVGERLTFPYFPTREPFIFEETATYAGVPHPRMKCYQWSHSLSEVVNALIGAGLALRELRELPYCFHPCYEFLREKEPGCYIMKRSGPEIPMLFTVKATCHMPAAN